MPEVAYHCVPLLQGKCRQRGKHSLHTEGNMHTFALKLRQGEPPDDLCNTYILTPHQLYSRATNLTTKSVPWPWP